MVLSVGGESRRGGVLHSGEVHEVCRTVHLVIELARVAELHAILHVRVVANTWREKKVVVTTRYRFCYDNFYFRNVKKIKFKMIKTSLLSTYP